MKFEFTGNYKSLTDFKTPNLPDFCVVTGLNGSGKSQFLEVINSLQNQTKNTQHFNKQKYTIELISPTYSPGTIKYIPYNGLNPNNLGSMNRESYNQIKNNILQGLTGNRNRSRNYTYQKLTTKIAKQQGKNYGKLTKKDIQDYDFSYEDLTLGSNDIFKTNLARIFYNYAYKREQNNFHEFRNQKYGTNHNVLSPEEFETKFPNPWELINRFLQQTKSDYFIKGIKEEEFNEHSDITPQFINKLSEDEVNINFLSTGEKIIVSLAFCLFNIELNSDEIFPKILLLDEPDAPLHPTLTKEFLDVIYEELVLKKKIQVILTTHSPSTVALVDKSYIYSMHKNGHRFRKCTKNEALALLTTGINTVSIEYENRRQIFVESNYDIAFYEKVYDKFKQKDLLEKDISLHFISSGIDKQSKADKISDGDSSRVKRIVKELYFKGGNKNVFGIIDWDGQNINNQSNENLRVNGCEQRYSLENYIFDPIILAAFLLDYQIIDRSFIELNNNENYTDFKSFSSEKLAQIAKKIVDTVKNKLETPPNLDLASVTYINNIVIDIPQWYLHYHGHSLEEVIVLKAFPKLMKEFSPHAKLTNESLYMLGLSKEEKTTRKNERKKKFENRLINIIKKKIVEKIYDNIPDFIPQEILDLLISIQKKEFN